MSAFAPAMRRTTRIPVYRQPPVWLVACVVVAAVLPLLLRAFGIEVGPAIDVSRTASARAIGSEGDVAVPAVALSAVTRTAARSSAAPPALASTALPVAGAEGASTPTPRVDPPVAIADDEVDDDVEADDDHESDDDIVVILDEPEASTDPTGVGRDHDRRAAPHLEPPATETRSVVAEAKLACRRGNKDAARSIVRDLPIGDPRRKQIRKACRGEGVWVL